MVLESSRKASRNLGPERLEDPRDRTLGRGGRPTALTRGTALRITDSVASGASYSAAAQAAGVGKSTFYRWCQLGRDALDARERALRDIEERQPELAASVEDLDELDTGEEPIARRYREFWEALMHACALARAVAETAVFADDKLAWLRYSPSARMNGERPWGRQDQVELADPGGRPLGSDALTQLVARIDAIADRKKALAEGGVIEGKAVVEGEGTSDSGAQR